jgi:hypothetical protein
VIVCPFKHELVVVVARVGNKLIYQFALFLVLVCLPHFPSPFWFSLSLAIAGTLIGAI